MDHMARDRQAPRTRRRMLGLLAAGTLAGCAEPPPPILPEGALAGVPGVMGRGWPTPGFGTRQFREGVSVLNVWASWCGYCRGEHGLLRDLARDGRFALLGLVHMDEPAKARDYLREAGNPYAALAHDPTGRLARILGQRGVPGTYVVARTGRVEARLRGALSPGWIERELHPAVKRAHARA